MKNKKMIGIALALGALAVMSRFDSILSPSVASMQAAFPEADPSSVESVVSIGASGAMFAGLVAGWLLSKLSFKVMGALACLCVAVGGIVPIFVHTDVSQLLVCAVIAGFGTGAASTMMPSLAARYFKGEKLQGVQGKLTVVQMVGSTLVVWVGGLLAVGGWINNYYLYFLAVVALVIMLAVAPNENAGQQSEGDGAERTRIEGRSQNIVAIGAALAMGFLGCMISAVLYTKLSVYLGAFDLGDSSVSGTLLMLNSAAAVVVGMLINPIKRVFKGFTMPFAFLALAVGSAFFVFTRTLVLTGVGVFCIGIGAALIMTSCPFILSNVSEQKRYPFVMGCFSCATSLGFTGSTWFFRAISEACGLDATVGTFQIMLVLGLVACVVLAALQFQKRIENCYLYE